MWCRCFFPLPMAEFLDLTIPFRPHHIRWLIPNQNQKQRLMQQQLLRQVHCAVEWLPRLVPFSDRKKFTRSEEMEMATATVMVVEMLPALEVLLPYPFRGSQHLENAARRQLFVEV